MIKTLQEEFESILASAGYRSNTPEISFDAVSLWIEQKLKEQRQEIIKDIEKMKEREYPRVVGFKFPFYLGEIVNARVQALSEVIELIKKYD